MFYDQRRGRTPRRPVFYGLKVTPVGNAGNPNPDPRATYKCKSCPPSKRTFELNGVKCHLKDKCVYQLSYYLRIIDLATYN